MDAVKKAVGDRLAVTTRYEVDTVNGERRHEHHDEGIRFVQLMHAEGVCDLWSVKIGDYEEWGEDAGSSRFRKSNWMRPFIMEVKGVVGDKVPVVSNGRFTSPDDMVDVIRARQCDIIGAHVLPSRIHFYPRKSNSVRPEDIRECIGCNMCVSRMQQQALLYCTQNATAGEEYRRGWHPEIFTRSRSPCSVLVVGAGPAGMECAVVLGKRGYDVHLQDKSPELGGHWKDVVRYPRCSEFSRVTTYRQIQLSKLRNVEVHLGSKEMTAGGCSRLWSRQGGDSDGRTLVFHRAGAETHLPIPGADARLPHVLTPEQIMSGKPVPGKKVVVVDGDGHFTGIAMAELMSDLGKEVTFVTNMHDIAQFSLYTMELANNKRMLYQKGCGSSPIIGRAHMAAVSWRCSTYIAIRRNSWKSRRVTGDAASVKICSSWNAMRWCSLRCDNQTAVSMTISLPVVSNGIRTIWPMYFASATATRRASS